MTHPTGYILFLQHSSYLKMSVQISVVGGLTLEKVLPEPELTITILDVRTGIRVLEFCFLFWIPINISLSKSMLGFVQVPWAPEKIAEGVGRGKSGRVWVQPLSIPDLCAC